MRLPVEVASWVALKSRSVVWHLYRWFFFLDVKILKMLFNVFLRLCWTSHSALPDGFRPLHQRQRHGGHSARSQLASRGEHLHPHVDGIPPHSQHQRTESHGQSACWHLLFLLTSLLAWVYRWSTLQNVCSWCAQTVFSSFGHLLSRDQGWQFHDQAWCWNAIRKCRQTWWWPKSCHKWAWLAYLLTLQNANLMGPMSGWFKDVCSGWCLEIVPPARALCC